MNRSAPLLAVDTHVHLYPHYDLAHALRSLFTNLGWLAPAGSVVRKAGLLAEAPGVNAFEDLRDGRWRPVDPQLVVKAGADPLTLDVFDGDERLGILVAGRQWVSRERLEVLALCTDARFEPGLPADALVRAVRAAGGVPVLCWSPGKWWGPRGRVVFGLIQRTLTDQLFLADTALRPLGWPYPRLLRLGERSGHRILAGSDALPIAGETGLLGRYGVVGSARPDTLSGFALRAWLQDGTVAMACCGERSAPLAFASRWVRNALRRKVRPLTPPGNSGSV